MRIVLGVHITDWWRRVSAAADGPFGNHETLANDLVSYWDLDEKSGVRYDSVVASANDLTDNNTVSYANLGPSGVVASLVKANSESLSHVAGVATNRFSVGGWVYQTGTGTDTGIISLDDAGSRGVILMTKVSGSGFKFYGYRVGSGSVSFESAATPAFGWHHVLLVEDPANSRLDLFIDGVLDTAFGSDGSATGVTGAALKFGHWFAGLYADANMGRMGLWSTALTGAEALTLYNSGKGKSYSDLTADELTGLVSYWNLDEVSGVRYDSHGANDLTDNNTVGSTTNAYPANMPGVVANFVGSNAEALTKTDNASLSLGSDSAFTFVTWFRPPASGLVSYNPLVCKWGGGGNAHEIEYRLLAVPNATADYLQITVGNNSSSGDADTFPTPILTNNAWHFIIFWHDPVANTLSVQINNDYTDSVSWSSGTFDGDGTFALGRTGSFGSFFATLDMSSTMYYSRVLTAQERTDLFNSGNGLFY